MNESHKLFEQYPLNVEKEISVGRVPTPYHTYGGHGSFMGGFADFEAISALLKDEQVHPMQTISGRAVIGIWVVDFTEASLGAHNELQFSILVSHEPIAPIEDHPLTLLKALFANPQARMFCYRLWNNTETVVAYNRELLGLDAVMNSGKIEYADGHKVFHFVDTSDNLIFEGQVAVSKRTPPTVGWQMFRLLGLQSTVKAISQPYLGSKVVNPISEAFPQNVDAQSYLASDTPVVQFFDTNVDTLRFGQTELAHVNFQPQFVEHFEPFRFVYLMPAFS